MKTRFLMLVIFLLAGTTALIVARSFRVGQIPNGNKNACANCHVNPAGGGPRNIFGAEVGQNHLTEPGGAGQVKWSPALAALDSDGDGFTNGQELQDPEGSWSPGQPAPGNPALVTNPGDATDFPSTTAVELLAAASNDDALESNYPNPFNPSTTVRFRIADAGAVRLEVFNSIGAVVRVLADGPMEAGSYAATWNGRDNAGAPVESGPYFVRLSAGDFVAVRRMLLVK